MRNKQNKTKVYPWDSLSVVFASVLSYFLVMVVMDSDSFLVFLIFLGLLTLIFEVLAYALFPKQIARYKEQDEKKEQEKEKARKEKALALSPNEQAFYNKFTRILSTLSETQFKEVVRGHVGIIRIVTDSRILYAENKAIFDFDQAKRPSKQGNERNYEAMKVYYEDLMRATESLTYLKKNMTVKGPDFGVITTNAADTLLYGAIVESDIKKQLKRNDYSQRALFENQVVNARKKLFSKVIL